jgi:hypothetical protein
MEKWMEVPFASSSIAQVPPMIKINPKRQKIKFSKYMGQYVFKPKIYYGRFD